MWVLNFQHVPSSLTQLAAKQSTKRRDMSQKDFHSSANVDDKLHVESTRISEFGNGWQNQNVQEWIIPANPD